MRKASRSTPASSARKRSLVEGEIVLVDEARLVALQARDLHGRAVQLQPRPDPHGVVGMPVRHARPALRRAVGRPLLDAEQEVENGRGGGRLAGLVEPEDDVEVRTRLGPRAEIDRIVAEAAVRSRSSLSILMAQTSASAARRWASTSSAPSRARTRSASAKASASAPNRSSREPGGRWPRSSSAIASSSSRNAFDRATSVSIRSRSSATGSADGARLGAGLASSEVSILSSQVLPRSRADPRAPLPRAVSASLRNRQASGVAPLERQPSHKVFALDRAARAPRAPPRSASAPRANLRRRRDRRRPAGIRRRWSAAPRPKFRGRRRS